MGCVMYYLLSSGGHPFGEGRGKQCLLQAKGNIIDEAEKETDDYKVDYPLKELPTTCYSKLAEHLIKEMIAKRKDRRYGYVFLTNYHVMR